MVSFEPDYRPHLLLPGFWSGQFGVNIKSVGVPPFADEIVVTQGSVATVASSPPSPSTRASGWSTTRD